MSIHVRTSLDNLVVMTHGTHWAYPLLPDAARALALSLNLAVDQIQAARETPLAPSESEDGAATPD